MDFYMLLGDLLHLSALIYLIVAIIKSKTVAGISAKSQLLLALVCTARYLDLFTTFISPYNTAFKIIFILCSYTTTYLAYFTFHKTCQPDLDTSVSCWLVAGCAFLGVACNYQLVFLEVTWAFSIYLEAVAMWPQFFMIYKTRTVRDVTFRYLNLLGMYRIFYVMHWIWRYLFLGVSDPISSISGSVQVVSYLAFWVLCLNRTLSVAKASSWFATNLSSVNDKDGIFTINVPEKNKNTSDRLLPVENPTTLDDPGQQTGVVISSERNS